MVRAILLSVGVAVAVPMSSPAQQTPSPVPSPSTIKIHELATKFDLRFVGVGFDGQLNGKPNRWQIASTDLQVLKRPNKRSILGYSYYYGNFVRSTSGTIVFARCDGKPAIAIESSDTWDRVSTCPEPDDQGPITNAYQQGLNTSTLTADRLRFSTANARAVLERSPSGPA